MANQTNNRDGRADASGPEHATSRGVAGGPGVSHGVKRCEVVGCVLAPHEGPHCFDLSESARLGAAAILERLKVDPNVAEGFRLALVAEPAAPVLYRMAAQLDEAAGLLRTIAQELAAGLALWPCECPGETLYHSLTGACLTCGGNRRTKGGA